MRIFFETSAHSCMHSSPRRHEAKEEPGKKRCCGSEPENLPVEAHMYHRCLPGRRHQLWNGISSTVAQEQSGNTSGNGKQQTLCKHLTHNALAFRPQCNAHA